MLIGASTWLWTSPLTTATAETLIPRVAQLGFSAVELPLEDPSLLDARRLGRLARDHGLTVSACGVFGPGRDLTNADARIRQTTHDYIKTSLDFAAEVGAPMLCGPLYAEVGKRRQLPEAERRAEWQLAVAGVRQACEAAAARKLRIAIEPLNRFETDLVHTAADAVRMARDVDHPAVGVMIDSFHMTIEEDNLEQAVLIAGEHLIHVQVSENQRGIPGTGLTDWAALARGLRTIGYRGMVIIESFTPDNRDLAGAVCIWKRRAPDQDTFASEGLRFLQQHFSPPSLLMSTRKINVAIIGLGFGAEFIPIYQAHPHARLVAVCQRNPQKLDAVADHFKVPKRYTDYDVVLADPEIDAVHINTPIPDHAAQSIKALRAGKHVACTVPMATSVEDCEQIVRLARETGKKYMMMETVVYAREFLFVRDLYRTGELGRIQFLQASHQQDMDGWPGYWPGLPPMHYATHCVGPCLALTRASAETVSCFGSGRIREEMIPCYGSPFAVESTHIKFRNSDVSARIYRSLFDTARQYRESFDVYGSLKTFEWPLVEGEEPVIHTAKKPESEIPQRVKVPDFAHLLPEPIRRFTTRGVYDTEGNEHLSFTQGGGHGGSHPHLAHEFISALLVNRDPFPNAVESANWTCTGILAHQSALRGGEVMRLPAFTLPG